MSQPVDRLPDGIPSSSTQFLHGCGLPAAWAGLPQWRILETGFGFGLNFLATWAAWRADPARPTLLHFVATEARPVDAADLLRAAATHPDLASLAQELLRQWWGLLPGVHRLRFDGGRVLLTLMVGDTQSLLRQQSLEVDSIYLHGIRPQHNPGLWTPHNLKALARCCRRGTRLAAEALARAEHDALAQCGFVVSPTPGEPPLPGPLQATYNPHWEPRPPRQPRPTPQPLPPGACIVIGGGIAGAATAASLARRGWQVRVLDQAAAPAAGASALPAGVFAPHVSPDDSVLSRLSRSGIRTTLQQAGELLSEGVDWSPCGVLEHRTDGTPGLGPGWADGAGADWSQPAPLAQRAAAQLPPEASACWHPKAGWVRPARLAGALLAQPGIHWQGNSPVAQLRRTEQPPADGGPPHWIWQALDAQDQVLAEAPTVVIAAGAGSPGLLQHRWPLQPVRGQVSWGVHAPGDQPLLPFPVNGNGNLVPCFPLDDSASGPQGWVMGSTFERDVDQLPPSPPEVQAAHATNGAKLQALLPQLPWPALQAPAATRAWAAVRCTAPDRLPIVGPVDTAALPGLWVCTAMGARGLTLALLCGELLAARLQGEPLPLDAKLALALASERL